ncbi:MAG: universal stress protein [Roseivirga sp.]|nr:universal stress protein [Roseivirga sp.]
MKIENILVPVDFSDCSNNALQYAIELAALYEAQLILLHCYVVHIPAAEISMDLQPQLAKEYQENAEKNFLLLKERMTELSRVNYREVIKTSFINVGITNAGKEFDADLIVMGTKGADNRIDAFFGSNTYHTIKKSELPVLAIPDGAKFITPRKILFAADFRYLEKIKSLDVIKTLSHQLNAEVQVLHVGHGWTELNMEQTKEAAAIIDYFGNTEHSYYFVKEELNVEEAIEGHLDKHQNEMLVLIARKHRFPGSLFKKKVTRHTVLHTNLPLLTIPDIQ